MYGFNPLRMEIARAENLGDMSVCFIGNLLYDLLEIAVVDPFLNLPVDGGPTFTVHRSKPPYIECGKDYIFQCGKFADVEVRVIETQLDHTCGMTARCQTTRRME